MDTSAFQKPKGMNLLLHLLVTPGGFCKGIAMREATWVEYFPALKYLAAEPFLPYLWLHALPKHEVDLTTMDTAWVWPKLYPWYPWDPWYPSEFIVNTFWPQKVFTMNSDGRHLHGWEDRSTIKDVQYDICPTMDRLLQHDRTHPAALPLCSVSGVPDSSQSLLMPAPSPAFPLNPYAAYSRKINGKPCPSNTYIHIVYMIASRNVPYWIRRQQLLSQRLPHML